MEKKGLIKLAIFAAILAVIFLPGYVRYLALKGKDAALQDRLVRLKKDNKLLMAEQGRLQTDLVYVEGKARDKMGLARKGEVVVKDAAER